MMNAIRKRNEQIVQLLDQGVSRRALARQFSLTPSRIALIQREVAGEKSLNARRARLREQIRQADDLDKTWPIIDLIDALWLIVITRVRLIAHFEELHKSQMTLRQFMDSLITESPDAASGSMAVPLLQVKGIGKKGFYSVIAEMAETDLGLRCNQEWHRRMIKLQRLWNIPPWPPNPRHTDED